MTRIPKQTRTRVVARYIAGRPLDGYPRTDATWLRRGTRSLDDTRPSRWHMMPGWKRSAYRVALPPALAAYLAAYLAEPAATTAGTGTAATVSAAKLARTARRRWRTRRVRRVVIRPLARVLGPILGVPEHTPPDRWLDISPELVAALPIPARPMSPAEVAVRAWYGERIEPALRWAPDHMMRGYWAVATRFRPAFRWVDWFRNPDTEDSGPALTVRVPSGALVTPDMAKAVKQAVSAKLGICDLVESWDQVGEVPVGRWTVRVRPPRKCGLDDIWPIVDTLPEGDFVLGLAAGGRPVTISLDDDSPHIACSAGSGAGKSVLASLIGAQVLRRGGQVLILDRKGSHRWARGCPGVTYCSRPADMHAALIGSADLADRRNDQAMEEEEGWDPGPRRLIIFEEMNATVAMLRQYWDAVREKSDPKMSPAIQAFRNVMFMGRSAKMNLFGVAQMLTSNTTGGPESRENFGVRCLARYTANNWKMLAPEFAMPRKSTVRGRWQIVTADGPTETQVAFLSPAEIRELATTGVPVSPSDAGYASLGVDRGQPVTGTAPEDPLAELVTFREAVDRGIVPGSLAAAKKRLQRAGDAGPTPRGRDGRSHTYAVGDLISWAHSDTAIDQEVS